MSETPWVIIGCGKSKVDHPAPAGDLYTGAYVRNVPYNPFKGIAPHDGMGYQMQLMTANFGRMPA